MSIEFIRYILYVIPGYFVLEIYHRLYPVKTKDQFGQFALSVIWGIVILFVVDQIFPNQSKIWLQKPDTAFFIVLLIGSTVLGLLGIAIHHFCFKIANKYPKLSWIAPQPQSIWAKVNLPSNQNWAIVFINDGSIYRGYISSYTFNPDVENQDFLLSRAACIDEYNRIKYEIDGLGVYLNTRDVKRIEFVQGAGYQS